MRKTKIRFLSHLFLYVLFILFFSTLFHTSPFSSPLTFFVPSALWGEGMGEGSSGREEAGRKTILDYKTEVGLNEKQVKEIKKLIGNYEKRVSANLEKINVEDKKLKELLASEGDIKEIGKRVREIYRLRGEIVVDDLETGRKIDQLLTKEQKSKWREIRKGTQNKKEK